MEDNNEVDKIKSTARSNSRSPPLGKRENRSYSPVNVSPRTRSRSPIYRVWSRSPTRRVSRSPTRDGSFSRSPTRRMSRSPKRDVSGSPTPIKIIPGSPIRRVSRSPARRRSRSPPYYRRSRSPLRRMSRSPLRRPHIRRSRSPLRRMSRSPTRRMSRSPIRKMSRSPIRRMSRSPIRRMSRSPTRRMSRSPIRKMSRSPLGRRSRSPPIRRFSRSPTRRMSRSPLGRRSRSPPIRRPISPYRGIRGRRSRSPSFERNRYRENHPNIGGFSRGRSPSRSRSRSPYSRHKRNDIETGYRDDTPIDPTLHKLRDDCVSPIRVDKLTPNITKDHIMEIFGLFGVITEINFLMDKDINQPLGIAIVYFKNKIDRDIARRYMDGAAIDGQNIIVKYAFQTKHSRMKTRK